MDQLSLLLRQHVNLLQERCAHLEKNICAVSNANLALEKAAGSSVRLQATGPEARHSGDTPSKPQRRDRPNSAVHAKAGRGTRQSRDSPLSDAEQIAQPLVDIDLCGIQHVPVMSAGCRPSEDVAQRLQQWRASTAQYFEELKSAGRFWEVQEECNMLLLRSSVLRQQQQAMNDAGEQCCAQLRELAQHSTVHQAHTGASPAAFCRGNPRNALICAVEVSCCVHKCAQGLEEAYVAGAEHAHLQAAAHSLAELLAAREHLLDLGQGQSAAADKLRQHTKDVSGSDAQGVPACSSVSERMHDDGTGLEDRVVGQCAALHQIGYAWQRAAPHQCSANIWPVSSHALPGMSWLPDDVWRMIATYEQEHREGELTASGPVGVVFENAREAKVWIIMLMQLQQLAWELYLMEASGVQLSEATFDLFRQPTPNTQAGKEQTQSFAALRALHALLLPARGPTLSVGLTS